MLDSARADDVDTMKPIPFSALPATQRDALLAALRSHGIAPQQVCVSRIEATEEGATGVMMVSAPGWCRTYGGAHWIAQLEEELRASRDVA